VITKVQKFLGVAISLTYDIKSGSKEKIQYHLMHSPFPRTFCFLRTNKFSWIPGIFLR
ncbi:hypothetical protein L9F63_007710, partial [Diploptera punctata]